MYMGYLFDITNPSQKAFAEKRQKYGKDLYHRLDGIRALKATNYEKD